MSIIRVEHLRKSFGDVTPIKDISFEVNEGDVISIIGPSGTGKSTLLRCINMLDGPTDGRIYFHDECVTDKGYDLTRLRKNIGMVFQSYTLFNHKNVIDNIIMAPMDILGLSRDEAEKRADNLLLTVGLQSKKKSYPDELSGGQRQRIAIARCLAMEPEIILLDEPTSALDPAMVHEVEALIKKMADFGHTMMIVTHEMEFARNVANRVFYLDEGGIYEEGTPEQIFDHPQKEKTIAFMSRNKSLEVEFDLKNIDENEISARFYDYGRRSGIPRDIIKAALYKIDERITAIVRNGVIDVMIFKLRIDYDENKSEIKTAIYCNGTEIDALIIN